MTHFQTMNIMLRHNVRHTKNAFHGKKICIINNFVVLQEARELPSIEPIELINQIGEIEQEYII